MEWGWEAPRSCPDGAAVERRFRTLAPEGCQRGGGEPLQVIAVATRSNRGWKMELTLRRGELSVTRSLTASSCAALAEATAVIAATACPALDDEEPAAEASDPIVDTPPDEPVPGETDADPLPDEPAPVVVEAPVPPLRDELKALPAVMPTPRKRRPGLELGARVAIAWGPTPAPAVVAGPALRLQWPAFELLLALDGGPRRRVAGPGPLGIDIRSATATIAGCPTAMFGSRRRTRLSLCLGVEAGALVGTGVGTPVTRTAVQPWLAALVGPSLTWSPRTRLNLGASVDVAASLTRPAFSLAGYDTVFRAAATSVRLRMFLAVQLW